MRWSEIVESSAAETAHKEAQKRIKARQKISDAQRTKSDASLRYQDQLRKADNAQRDAQAELRTP